MGYTRQEIIKRCEDEMANPSTFYKAPFINYHGKTTDTNELYNEIVAEFVCNHLTEFVGGIKKITREETYKTKSHTGERMPSNSREEEQIAVKLFNQKCFDFIGEMIDYQTPLKNSSEDEGTGKIDLLSYDGKTLYILELKKPDSTETMLRCVLEGFTYLKTVDTEKLILNFDLPKDTKAVACPLVFRGKKQYNEMREERPWLKKVMDLLVSKPYYISTENGKYFVTEKGPQTMQKDLNKLLDLAIMANETADNSALRSGYTVQGKAEPYPNYIENNCWNEFKKDMEEKYPVAFRMYGAGGGKELDERKIGKYICPPKMASFGSSSRMIFNLLKKKEKDGFLFEQKLPTTVGGKANLDGFMMTDDKCIFVEAKCREPYTAKDSLVSTKYKPLYKFISESSKTNLVCRIPDSDNEKKMEVIFIAGNTEIQCFDMKQMICHLLSIATAYLKGKIDDKEIKSQNIEFIYLLFNPKLIEIKEGKAEIHSIYEQNCNECNAVDFKALFGVIVDYLQTVKGIGKDKNKAEITNNFSFRLCDQSNMNI